MSADVIKMKFNKVTKVSAEWCGPCKQYAPIFDEFSNSIKEEWKVIHLDLDTREGREFADKHGIRGVPATVIERQGKDPEIIMGMKNEQQLIELFKED
jgi:thioredoxin 1